MAQRRVRLYHAPERPNGRLLERVFDRIRAELEVPGDFGPDVLAAAAAAARTPQLPAADATSVPFFTIDPVGSMDLDQAMHLERDGAGYRVRYAIADVPAFVEPGGLVDAEARRRGQTLYAPDRRTPLHPPSISEGAASLLPGEVRPAFVWDLRLDGDGEVRAADVARAMVRSVDRLDFEGVQQQVDSGSTDERFVLLGEIGERRIRLEVERGGSSLPLPEQEVRAEGGHYSLRLRPTSAVEDWNAQISLMTGMAAADLMLVGHIGILRTMPAPSRDALARFHRQAMALGARWPAEQGYGEFLRTLDRGNAQHLALIHEATSLFRGAGYTPFDGSVPEATVHAAVADQYAHVTAPLRRLVDRFALAICEALCRDVEVPAWVREALPQLPKIMAASDRLAGRLDRATTDAVEAAVLAHRVGEEFDGVVVDIAENATGGHVQISDPAVLAPVDGGVSLGAPVRVRLVTADIEARRVAFAPV